MKWQDLLTGKRLTSSGNGFKDLWKFQLRNMKHLAENIFLPGPDFAKNLVTNARAAGIKRIC